MGDEQRNLELAWHMGELWNAGRFEEMFAFYDEDIEAITDPSWPEPSTKGKEAFVRGHELWREAWGRIELDPQRVEANGDKVFVEGAWDMRGASSGIGGSLPFGMVLTLRDGLVVVQQWFMDPSEARRAAGLG